MNVRKFLLLLITLISLLIPTAKADDVRFEIKINAGLIEFSDVLFEAPAYAVLALQNAGIPISLSKKIIINSATKISMGSEKFIYLSKSNNKYNYKASVNLPFGREINIPIKLDIANIKNGSILVYVELPLSNYLPNDLIVRLETKVLSITNDNTQKLLLNYLNKININKNDNSLNRSRLFEAIVFDAINQSLNINSYNGNSYDNGKAEPLSNQFSLIVAILIWLIGFPISLYLVRKYRKQI